jgi:hypothetical protein
MRRKSGFSLRTDEGRSRERSALLSGEETDMNPPHIFSNRRAAPRRALPVALLLLLALLLPAAGCSGGGFATTATGPTIRERVLSE